jgi:hypothetical protein
LFSANNTFVTSTAAAKIISPIIFNSAPTFRATNVTSENLSTFSLYPKSFASSPVFNTTGASGHLSFVNFSAYESQGAMTAADADGTIHIELWNDFTAGVVSGAGAGEETVGTRNMFLCAQSGSETELNGVRSYITPSSPGQRRLFINHTGGADSIHVGDFYIQSMLSADHIQLTGGYVAGYVKPFVSLLKTVAVQQNIGGANDTTVPITWDVQDHIDSTFTHSTSVNPSRITINESGRYEIYAMAVGDNEGGARLHCKGGIQIDGGAVSYRGGGKSYSRGNIYGYSVRPWFRSEREITAGEYIEFVSNVEDTDAVYVADTIDDECELIIRKIS